MITDYIKFYQKYEFSYLNTTRSIKEFNSLSSIVERIKLANR